MRKLGWITRAKKRDKRFTKRRKNVPAHKPNNYLLMQWYKKLATNTALYDPPDNPNPEEILIARDELAMIERAMLDLSPREEYAVRLYHGFDGDGPRSLDQVGEVFSVSRERARQILAKSYRKLKNPSRGLQSLRYKYRYQYSSHYERKERERELQRDEQRSQWLIGTALPAPPPPKPVKPKRIWFTPTVFPYVQEPRPHANLDDPMHVWTEADVLREMLRKALIARGMSI